MKVGVAAVLGGVTTLGPGRRVGLWVQGCDLACPGCMSPELFEPGGATWYEVEALATRIFGIAEGHQGLTISGGEPFHQAAALAALVGRVRAVRPDMDVLVYSGYALAEILQDAEKCTLANSADMIIDGRFDPRMPNTLPWRGSDNQVLHALTDTGLRAAGIVPSTRKVQIGFDGETLRIIGIPPRGALREAERRLRAAGVGLRKIPS